VLQHSLRLVISLREGVAERDIAINLSLTLTIVQRNVS
jgi:hypothetical protein